ncbi:MAG: MG2 domain-containing protein, partial [Bacteroidales bacterium]|nr:MG2 domain-containing protein [Bacteroidales bacterium]
MEKDVRKHLFIVSLMTKALFKHLLIKIILKMRTSVKLIISTLLIISSTIMFAQENKFYKKNWSEIDSLENQGLPKSALEIAEKIYIKAKKEDNTQQIIKSFIYRLKFKNEIEENAFEKLCYELDSAALKAKFPEKNIMHTMLADMYWWYYQNNSYKFQKRSNTINFDKADMQTWTLDDLVNEIIKNYRLSLENAGKLQKIKIEDIKDLLIPGTQARILRPTLYDFLAYKAIDFFSNTEISVTKPADNFQLKDASYFDGVQKFVHLNLQTTDTLSLHFYALKILQDLLKFRLLQDNKPALILADLQRLTFIYRYSVNNNKDELYLKALKNLEKKYLEEPYSAHVAYNLAKYYRQKARKYNPLDSSTFKYKDYNKIAHNICTGVLKKFPEAYISDYCKNMIIDIESRNLSFTVKDVVVPENTFSIKVSYHNIPKIYVRAGKIDRAKYKKLNQKYYGEDFYNALVKNVSIVSENSYELPGEIDFNAHSVELLLEKLPVGFYVLFIADNPDFSFEKAVTSYRAFNVSGIAYAEQSLHDGAVLFELVNRKTGQPLKGVTCQTWWEDYIYNKGKYIRKNGKSYITNEQGIITIPAGNKNHNYFIDFKLADDFLSTESSYYVYKNQLQTDITIRTSYFTDRAIYRPGQTIYFKGISIKTDGKNPKIITNHTETVKFLDANYQKLAELELITNDYGTFSGTFDIPTGLRNGIFHIQSETGSINISVEEYKRPKFEVEMLPFKGNYLLNDTVEVSGKAISYSGAALSDAKIKYRITRTPKWRGWWSWQLPQKSIEIAHGTGTTADDGIFKINFKALPDLAYQESEFLSFNFSIVVDVTDINGETQSTQSNINIGYRALQLSLPIPELINKEDKIYDDEQQKLIKINTYNLNYQPVNAQGEIKIYKLKDFAQVFVKRDWEQADKHLYTKKEWYKLYPGHEYANEADIKNLEKEKEVFVTHFNTAESDKLDFSIVKKFKTGIYVAEITSKDAFGNPVSNKHFFKVYSQKAQKPAYATPDFFTAINNHCEPGETAEFLIATSDKNVHIIYQIEHKGKIVHTEYLNLNNEQKLVKIPVEEKHRGNFSVHFVFIKNNHYYEHSSIVYVPYSNKNLDISFETFRDKLQPGEKEQWRIKISGYKGEKVAAEMLATLYDASLDQFKKNNWYFNVYHSYYTERDWKTGRFGQNSSSQLKKDLDKTNYIQTLYFDEFNWFGFSFYS